MVARGCVKALGQCGVVAVHGALSHFGAVDASMYHYGVVALGHGRVALYYCIIVELRHRGTVALWHCGVVMLLRFCFLLSIIPEVWHSGILFPYWFILSTAHA